MPGRVASASTRAPRKVTTVKSARGRTSSLVTEVPDEGADTSLRIAICSVFADSQKSTAGHRKSVITLRKTQEECCYKPVSQKKGKQRHDFDEEEFNTEVVRCVLRILPVKKAETAGDRVVRFLGTFLNVASAKDNAIAQQDDEEEMTIVPETPSSRLTTQILETLLPLLQAKEKTIRFRATQITSHIINSLDTLDDNLFHKLRQALLKRIRDKEAPVRLQAVYGLGRLAAEVENDDEKEDSDSDDEASGVLQKLLQVLQHDPSAEVRRNLLLNLPLTKEVLPYILERARDYDALTRRALYARLLPALGDFRHLGLTHREKVLRWGLRDRDENVRKATARLFYERWIEDCAALPATEAAEQAEENGEEQKPANQVATPSLEALLELLQRIDVVNTGVEGGFALTAMSEFWQGRPDYFQYVSFPDTFWEDLTPELAFVARTFNDHCRSNGLEGIVEEKLPEVTKFGFLLDHEINELIKWTLFSTAPDSSEISIDGIEEKFAHSEFIVEQMLHMALTFDYSDHFGRSKMYNILTESLAKPDLPEEVTRLVVENLRLNCGEDAKGENHFCSIVLAAIAEVHDTILGSEPPSPGGSSVEESFHSATSHFDGKVDDDTIMVAQKKKARKQSRKTPDADAEADEEKAIKEIMVNMKCLHIAQCMLQNVSGQLTENVHLVTALNSLVVPAVRSKEAPLRERGFYCLGLCCLLGKTLAAENLDLFLHCFKKGHTALQIIAIQILTDIIIAHPTLLAADPDITTVSDLNAKIIATYKAALKSPDPNVQSTGATALAKAMLSRLVTDTALLQQLVVLYFDNETTRNPLLRQSLSYFLPVYCHSSAENAERMVAATPGIVGKLFLLRKAFDDEDVEEDGEGGAQLGKLGEMLIDWTDPRKIFAAGTANSSADSGAGVGMHLLLAETILERLVTSTISIKEEKKALLSMLGKLHLPPAAANDAPERVKTCLEFVTEGLETGVAADKVSTDALKKLQKVLLELFRETAMQERGGAEGETVIEPTVAEQSEVEATDVDETVADEATPKPSSKRREIADSDDEAEDEDASVAQLQQEMRDATLGATLTGFPDAEGTRIGLGDDEDGDEDTEMTGMDD